MNLPLNMAIDELKKTPWQQILSVWNTPVTASIVIAETVIVIFSCVSPLIQRIIIDALSIGNWSKLIFATTVLLATVAIGFVCEGIARWLVGKLEIATNSGFKTTLFQHLINLPQDFLRNRGAGYFFNRIQSDIHEAVEFLAGLRISVWTNVLELLLSLGIIAVLQWKLAVLLLPFVILQIAICRWCQKKQYHISNQIQECNATEQNVMLEYLSHSTTFKTHAATDYACQKIESGMKSLYELMLQRLTHESFFTFLLRVPVMSAIGGVFIYGSYCVIHKLWSLGDLWAILGLMRMVFSPSGSLTSQYIKMQSALSAFNRLRQLLALSCESNIPNSNDKKISLRGKIEFKHVFFDYAENPVLENVSFTVASGELLFIMGENGCGKTTLLSLLLRLYKPGSGSITIDGCPIEKFNLGDYRSRIGYIGQHPELFAGTLRENLCVGNNHSSEKIKAAFYRLGCENIINFRPLGLESPISENGDNLSGGERLRIVLIRELLRDTDIMLCDEAAANLDADGRQRFYELLQKTAGEKTIIAVAHSLPEHLNNNILQLSKNNQIGEIKNENM